MKTKNDYLSTSTENIISSLGSEFWNSIDREAFQKRVPIHGHFEITPQCNLDCKMCYVHLNKTQMNNKHELTLDQWKKIIDGGMVFASISGGECLTSPYFDELYLYLNSKGVIIFILTNGVLLSNKIKLFKQYPPALIQVSMYGYDEDSYEKVTGKRKFTVVSNAVKEAKANGLNISIAVTTSKYLKSVYKIVRKYYQMEIGVAVSKWLIPPYSSTGRQLDEFCLSPEEQVNISGEILLATDEAAPVPFTGVLPPPNTKGKQLCRGLKCTAGRNSFSINWQGKMLLCVSLNEVTGEPLQEDFMTAWQKTVNAADEFLIPVECTNCSYKSVCRSCPAHHMLKGEDGHCNPDICEEGVLLVKRGIKTI